MIYNLTYMNKPIFLFLKIVDSREQLFSFTGVLTQKIDQHCIS